MANRSREHIHYGSLEKDAVAYAKRKREEEALPSQPHTDLDDLEPNEQNEESLVERQTQLAEFERKRLARTLAVPTDDTRVKESLRKYNEPICLFGEDAGDRRTRLRYIMSLHATSEPANAQPEGDESAAEDDAEEFYTEGSGALLGARRHIAEYSVMRAKSRIARQKVEFGSSLAEIRAQRNALTSSLRSYSNFGSQVDDRPVARCAFSADSRRLLTASWSGLVRLWSVPECNLVATFRAHTDRVGGISFHPDATLGDGAASFASGGADAMVYLWATGCETPVGKLAGHASRVANVAHHPCGQYLGSASYDGSWRLWDLPTQCELLLQEGHAREVFCIKFQGDGALAASAGLDGLGRVWDMRSGRSIMALEGHAREIYALDWAPNGYQVATGGADNSILVFDLRKRDKVHQIPAHKSVVTDLRYFCASSVPAGDDAMDVDRGSYGDGQYLASSSNDGLVNVWSCGDWKLQKSLAGHTGKVMSVDIARDGSYIASAGFDRTFKLWGPDAF